MLPAGKPVDIEGAVLGIRLASYICLVSLVLILYDHILTFTVELESFWTLGLTWLRGLFFLNRYLSIILAAIQLYSITSESLTGSICAALNAFTLYGVVIIVTFSSIVQFTRVYILYKPQRWVIYALMASMLALWGSFLCFVIIQQQSLSYSDDSLPAIGHGCIGCRPSRTGAGGKAWRAFVPILIQQTVLAGMILFKGFTTSAKGEHARGVMGVVMRDGAIVYLVILFSLVICFLGASVRSLGIPLSVANILLPVFSICTTRLLVNLRGSPFPYAHHKHNDLFSGVEMTGLYLGGYLGGIAPARGVEGAVVTEIGNTTIIEVPVVDLADGYSYACGRGGPSRCGERPGSTVDGEGGGNGRPLSECHASMTASSPLKVSALGATPGWERWDHRLPTKDFKLPSASPQERGLHFEDVEEEEGTHPFDEEVLLPRVQNQTQSGERERASTRNSTATSTRRSQNRASDRGGSARSNSFVSMAATVTAATPTSPTPLSSVPSVSEMERPGTSGTQRTLVHKGSYYTGWPSDDGKGGSGSGAPHKPPL